jgi:hypothetical protein
MDSVVRNVFDLSADERQVYESVLGQALQNNQQIIVQLVNPETGNAAPSTDNGTSSLLEPYAIWADFADEEIAELESAILDRSESRPT